MPSASSLSRQCTVYSLPVNATVMVPGVRVMEFASSTRANVERRSVLKCTTAGSSSYSAV